MPTKIIKRAPFSIQDLQDWLTYEKVRKTSSFNMYEPRARRATGLSRERYSWIQDHYDELKAAEAILKPIE